MFEFTYLLVDSERIGIGINYDDIGNHKDDKDAFNTKDRSHEKKEKWRCLIY